MTRVLNQAGYATIAPSIIQDAAAFIDLGGEEIRASLYFTSDRQGSELCLRPEFTIPVCRAYLAGQRFDTPAQYSCSGPVFRFRSGESDEFIQVDLESFGRTDTAAADAEVLGLALDALAAGGSGPLALTFGDAGLLTRLLDTLQLPASWQRRFKRGLDKGESPAAMLSLVPGPTDAHAGVLAALAGTDEAGARALVDDLLSIAGIKSVGGRTAAEIAERFLGQVALRAVPAFGSEQRAVLDRYLAISGQPDEAAAELRGLARDARVDLSQVLDLFEERISFMAVQGVDLATTRFSATFVRNLDYYTGFVFEARSGAGATGPILGGGRYDRLAQALGHGSEIPAVGAAIWVDRIDAGGRGVGTR